MQVRKENKGVFNNLLKTVYYNNIDKPIYESAMSTKSSAYIKWLINKELIIHPAFNFFYLLLRSSM